MKALVTGATGFLGQHLTRRLVDEGVEVKATGRNVAIGRDLETYGATFVGADLTDRRQVRAVARDIDVIFHTAAQSSVWGSYESFQAANVSATRWLLDAAMEQGEPRFIYVSSPTIYVDGSHRRDVGEDDVLPERAVNHYATTKRVAEGLVASAAQRGLVTYTIRPRAIFGEGDTAIFARLVRANAHGGIPFIDGGKALQDITYVDNVVEALLCCANAPHSSGDHVYNITNGEPRPIGAILTTLFAKLERPLRRRDVPYPVAYALASLTECSAKFFGAGEPTLTRYGVIALGRDMTLDIARARTELGYAPTIGVDEGLERLARWSKRH